MRNSGRPSLLPGRFDIPGDRKGKGSGRRLANTGKQSQPPAGDSTTKDRQVIKDGADVLNHEFLYNGAGV